MTNDPPSAYGHTHTHPAYQIMPSGAVVRAYWPANCPGCADSVAPADAFPRPPVHMHDGPYGLAFKPVDACGGCQLEERNSDGTVGPFDAYEGEPCAPLRVWPQVTWFNFQEWLDRRGVKA